MVGSFREFDHRAERHRQRAQEEALLLHMAGEAVYEIYDGLFVAAVAQDADPEVDNVYPNTKQALDNHFNQKRNAEEFKM